MKKKIYISVFITFCILLSVGIYSKLAQSSSKESNDSKSLVSVEIYDISNPEQIITLKPQLDGSLISQYSQLLADQVPDEDISGTGYEIIVFYSDDSQSLYGINSTQEELFKLCNKTLNSYNAKQL